MKNENEIYYYMVIDSRPFVVIMKKTKDGWFWGDTIMRGFTPTYYGKSKPRPMFDESYVLTRDWNVAMQYIEYQAAEWKRELMDDFHLTRNAGDYLKNLREYNKEVFHQYYLTPNDRLIYMRTLLHKDRSWRQEIGILEGDGIARRSWYDNDRGSEEPMRTPGPNMRPITDEIARYKGEQHIDRLIEKKINAIKEFCEVI